MTKQPLETLDAEARPINITSAINAVMAKVGYVLKQKGKDLNYTYAGEAALIAALRPWLVEYGIVIYPSGVHDLRVETYTTSKGSTMNRTIGLFKFTFAHAESGTSLVVEVLGEGADIGDKSANKAMTGALKYAWRQTFGIETGDDPDKVSSDTQERLPVEPLHVKHWSENPDYVAAFNKWRETNDIRDSDLIRCFGSVNLYEFPKTMKETKAQLEAYIASQGDVYEDTEEDARHTTAAQYHDDRGDN